MRSIRDAVAPRGDAVVVPETLRYAAFTRDGRGGNPAGVVLGADDLTDAQMLSIAQAVGYSETAFVRRPATDGGQLDAARDDGCTEEDER